MILCVGATPTVQRTLRFDRLTIDAVNRAANVTESSSGKSINVARMLHTLGREVLATGFLGGDAGRFVRNDLSSIGIPHEFVEVEAKTRTCTTAIDLAAGTVTELVEESKPVASGAYAELLAMIDANLWRAKVLVLSGSLTPGAPQDFYARCTRLARAVGVPVVLDGRGEPLRLALPEKPDVVKPNRQELHETVGEPIDTDELLRHAITSLLTKGPRWAVVTHGSHDAVASDGSAVYRVTPPKIATVNPIGSGDSFAAGMAIALADGRDLPAACTLGAACGAANALNSPAGHGRREDVERLIPAVKVVPW